MNGGWALLWALAMAGRRRRDALEVFFNPKSLPAQELGYDDPLCDLCCRAETDAHTREIMDTEEFSFRISDRDLEYLLKRHASQW